MYIAKMLHQLSLLWEYADTSLWAATAELSEENESR